MNIISLFSYLFHWMMTNSKYNSRPKWTRNSLNPVKRASAADCSNAVSNATEPYLLTRCVNIPAPTSTGSQCDMNCYDDHDNSNSSGEPSASLIIPNLSSDCDLLLQLSIENDDMTKSHETVRFRSEKRRNRKKCTDRTRRTKSEYSLKRYLQSNVKDGKESFL